MIANFGAQRLWLGTQMLAALSVLPSVLPGTLASTSGLAFPVAERNEQPPTIIEDQDGRALAAFYDLLSSVSRRESVARIIHYGDSHVAADLMTGELRRDLTAVFGDAGPGFAVPIREFSTRGNVATTRSSGWKVVGLTREDLVHDSALGLAGLCLGTEAAGEWIKVMTAASRIDLYLLEQPLGGKIEVFLDGSIYESPLNLNASVFNPRYLTIDATQGRAHEIEIRTITPGRVKVLGISAEQNAPGIVYDALGINGARAGRPLLWNWSLLASNIERCDPDLIVLAYGTNEAGDVDLDFAEYASRFRTMLDRFRKAAPRASLLVIGPTDRAVTVGKRWRTIDRLPALIDVQRSVARAAGAAFFDLFQTMGGEGSIERWVHAEPPLAQADRVHLTAAGYRLLGDKLFDALMRGYFESLAESSWTR